MIPSLDEHLEKLSQFCAAAQAGSIRFAAKKLKISQPSLSKSIRLLEEACGTQLFIRGRDGVRLTANGSILFRFASDLARDTRKIERLFRAGTERAIPIRIATHELFVPRMIPRIFLELKKIDPNLSFALETAQSSSKMIKMIADGQTDIGFVVEGTLTASLQRKALLTDSYSCFASAGFLSAHKISARRALPLDELSRSFPFIYAPEVTASTSATIEDALRTVGPIAESAYQVTSIESVSALVNAGFGIGLLPTSFGAHLRTSGVKAIPVDFGGKTSLGELTMYAYFGDFATNQEDLIKQIIHVSANILKT